MDTIDLFGNASRPDHGSVLARTFEYPPFSVLSARDGWWQERKRQWLALGIKSELGRGGGATWNVGYVHDGGLTWGNSPEITQKGLNYYRERKAK